MGSTKAPAPDEMNAGVLRSLWEYAKDGFLNFFTFFHDMKYIPPWLSSSFMALVPKSNVPSKPSDFRPISLMNVSLNC